MRRVAHQPLVREPRKRNKRFAVTKKPCLGHDDQFDERLPLVVRCIEQLPVSLEVALRCGRLRRPHAIPHRALERMRAERGRTDAGLAQEPAFEACVDAGFRVHDVDACACDVGNACATCDSCGNSKVFTSSVSMCRT